MYNENVRIEIISKWILRLQDEQKRLPMIGAEIRRTNELIMESDNSAYRDSLIKRREELEKKNEEIMRRIWEGRMK